MANTPLAVLDLVPVASRSTPADALRNSVDLAQQAERLGYRRYWVAEHHLNPGVAGTSPAVVIALLAGATDRIRLGSGAVQMGHRTALSVVEEFGLLDQVYPGRLDLGLGRSSGRPMPRPPVDDPAASAALGGGGAPGSPALVGAGAPPPSASPTTARNGNAGATTDSIRHAATGLKIPKRFSMEKLLGSPRFAMQKRLLTLPEAKPQNYTEQVDDVLALLAGTYRSPEGADAHVVPGEGAALELWILGSSGGESATVAGHRGLRFAANYHVSPATVLEAVDGYRAAFHPSSVLDRPYVSVSADVVVADTAEQARELAAGYGRWVHSIRCGAGAVPFPTPDEAHAQPLTDEELALVIDRLETQFVGSPVQVADQLEQLRAATEADELIVTTITHDHADRVRSYQLLAEEWQRRA
ncbi:MAG TPA: LLM class flavin-dependent oxidoreductase [Acidimicrobiales bacterium]|nr:LLM class flavin-dependent oxidoreductase [Acidimicrobiales bacterium]